MTHSRQTTIFITLFTLFVTLLTVSFVWTQNIQNSAGLASSTSLRSDRILYAEPGVKPVFLLQNEKIETSGFETYTVDEEEDYFARLTASKKLLLSMTAFVRNEDRRMKVDKLLLIENNPFRLLDIYQPLDNNTLIGHQHKHLKLGLAQDKYYCDAADLLNMYNTDNWISHNSYATEFESNKYLLDFLSSQYKHQNEIINSEEFKELVLSNASEPQPLSEEITFFFKKREDFAFYSQIGLNNTCLTQAYGFVPNLDDICQKANFPKRLRKYDEQYVDRRQCFSAKDIFPTTYILSDAEDCKEFFDHINSAQYLEDKAVDPFQFLFKKGIGLHKGLGVSLLTDELEDTLRSDFQDGSMCGLIAKQDVVQKYIPNPLLLKGTNKFDFRVYALIASTNPMIAFYRDGIVRVSLRSYDRDSTDIRVHLTNTYLSDDILKNITDSKEQEEAKQFQIIQFPAFQELLLESGMVTDENWLENELKPQLKSAIVHILRMGSKEWFKGSGLFRLTGFDFMLDDNMKLWFIEANARPGINEDPSLQEFTNSKIGDMMEIIMSLLRSRISRLQRFVKDFTRAHILRDEPFDKAEMRSRFFELNKDRIDPRFAIRKDNTWEPIIDENLSGAEAYFGTISEECI